MSVFPECNIIISLHPITDIYCLCYIIALFASCLLCKRPPPSLSALRDSMFPSLTLCLLLFSLVTGLKGLWVRVSVRWTMSQRLARHTSQGRRRWRWWRASEVEGIIDRPSYECVSRPPPFPTPYLLTMV